MKFGRAWIVASLPFLLAVSVSRAQELRSPGSAPVLSDLLAEAEHNNPQVQAARHGWEAAKHVPTQVSTLPDPQIMVQQLNVGSPRPFAGFTNSDFAYIGLGFSQDIPYPGKLRLHGEIAKKEADVLQEKYESVRRAVLADVKQTYFRLAYLMARAKILEDDRVLAKQVEESAEARYRDGLGNQQEVLQAQLEQTKLLREVTANQLDVGKTEAVMKQLLNRPQSSPDIEPAAVSETAVAYTYDQLLAAANANNPEIAAAQKMVERQQLQVDLAKRDFYPDFNVQFLWQQTDPSQYRPYFMFTFGVRVPVYRRRRQQPELAQAEADRNRSQSESEAETQQVAFDLRQQFVSAEKSAELLKIYRDGLLPQARAELQAGLAVYQSGRGDFQALLASFLDVLKLDEEYWQTLSEHEIALAQMEEATGLSLR